MPAGKSPGGGWLGVAEAYRAAHELGNAATALHARAQLAERRALLSPPQVLAEMLADIARDAAHLARLSLKVVRPPTPFAARSARCDLRGVLRACAHRASTTSWEITVDVPIRPVWIQVDRDELEQVLDNLIGNALKYSPRNTEVRLTCLVSHSGQEAIVRIRDHGTGISPSDQARIFDAFFRSADAKDHAPGTGLGLAIARELIEANGGRLELEASSSAGSTFTVRIPIARERRGLSRRGSAPRSAA